MKGSADFLNPCFNQSHLFCQGMAVYNLDTQIVGMELSNSTLSIAGLELEGKYFFLSLFRILLQL